VGAFVKPIAGEIEGEIEGSYPGRDWKPKTIILVGFGIFYWVGAWAGYMVGEKVDARYFDKFNVVGHDLICLG
jgi:hypothetical protein